MLSKAAPVPVDEADRLRALRLYRILDSGSERSFDDLTRLAAAICDAPISLITLVDENRQWFKSRVGLDVEETTRDVASAPMPFFGTRSSSWRTRRWTSASKTIPS